MKLLDRYMGGDDPFEGDRTLILRSLLAGARVTKATITLTPVARTGGTLFAETFTFVAPVGPGELLHSDWGITKTAPGPLIEVDFHARRTLAAVEGTQGDNIKEANLQVDMGGAYVGVADDGTFMAPGKTPWPVALSSTSPAALPGLTVKKFSLSGVPKDPKKLDDRALDITKVTIRSVPINISVRLGEMPPFWTRLGELAATAGATSPDFAPVLSAFLAEAKIENGFYAIPFVVHSDSIARLDVELAIDFVIEQPVLPSHLPEITVPYGFSTLPGTDEALTLTLPRAAIPVTGRTSAHIRGEFQPSRIALPPIDDEPPIGDEPKTTKTISVLVSPECTLAQPLRSDKEIAVTGVDLPLANTEPGIAGLNVAIQDDADGKPSGEVRTSAEVRVEKPLPGQSTWGSATLPTPFRVLRGVRYWLVLQSRLGEGEWGATVGDAKEPPLQCSRDGGLSWRAATAPRAPGPLSALFRLRHTPERFSIPVQLQIGKGRGAVPRRLDEFAPLGRVEFTFDFAEKLGEHLSKPEVASPCGKGELLTNGSFDQPPHDDATRRLFGFDAHRESGSHAGRASLSGLVNLDRGVDLSVQRFILLSIDGGDPVRIDCAGAIPGRTRPDEVVAAINRTMRRDVAGYDNGLIITSPMAGSASAVELHFWSRLQVPQAWGGEASRVLRVKIPPLMIVALPVLPAAPAPVDLVVFQVLRLFGVSLREVDRLRSLDSSELVQQIPVVAGCDYVLRFLYRVLGLALRAQQGLAPTPGLWQIRWLDGTGKVLATDGATLAGDLRRQTNSATMYEVRLSAPDQAVKAELRFAQPPHGFLLLGNVSFASTLQALDNTSFQRWEVDRLPSAWVHLGGSVEPLLDREARQILGANLLGDGPEGTILVQTVKVVAGDSYEMRVRARPRGPIVGDPEVRPVQERARLEFRWRTDGSLGEPVILLLDGRGFHTQAWAGTAPVGANQAEVRLVQPQGRGNLLVEELSLARTDMVSVPLTFLAEVPGELIVSDLRVAYDLPERPGAPRAVIAGYVRAREVVHPLERSLAGVLAPAEPAAPAAPPPMTVIDGIGEKRAERLAAIGIDSVEKLAAATPETVAPVLRGVQPDVALKLAAQFIKEAQKLLRLREEP